MGNISLDTLVLAKKYTDKVLTGLGALKGSPCTIKATKEIVSSKTGVHGFRYYNGTLQVQNAEGDWFDVISGGGDSSNIHQLSFLNVRTNDVKYLNLDVGNVFTKSLIQAFKFIPGESNIVETLKSFNNADASNFNFNDEIVEFTDKGMGIKDTYKLNRTKYNDGLYITEAFNKDDFVDINTIDI